MPTRVSPPRLRVAAIQFLNPAPLLYDFEHPPRREQLLQHYAVRYTSPAQCAEQLRLGAADLGLVPIGAMPYLPGLVAVPGCAIASLHQVRSIQLVLRAGVTLSTIRSIAADAASRSSAAYVQLLLRKFHGNAPATHTETADLLNMFRSRPERRANAPDAALLIGDPALIALQARDRNGAFADCTWIDVASWWRECTGLPWVAAVWAVRREALEHLPISADRLIEDLAQSRQNGLAHIDALVHEWEPRIALSPDTIRTYLTRHIYYHLDTDCLAAVARFYAVAAETGVLPPYTLPML